MDSVILTFGSGVILGAMVLGFIFLGMVFLSLAFGLLLDFLVSTEDPPKRGHRKLRHP